MIFLKLIIYVTGGHCGYCPWAPKNLPMPLSITINKDYFPKNSLSGWCLQWKRIEFSVG